MHRCLLRGGVVYRLVVDGGAGQARARAAGRARRHLMPSCAASMPLPCPRACSRYGRYPAIANIEYAGCIPGLCIILYPIVRLSLFKYYPIRTRCNTGPSAGGHAPRTLVPCEGRDSALTSEARTDNLQMTLGLMTRGCMTKRAECTDM